MILDDMILDTYDIKFLSSMEYQFYANIYKKLSLSLSLSLSF
jgi:hypothetical protein